MNKEFLKPPIQVEIQYAIRQEIEKALVSLRKKYPYCSFEISNNGVIEISSVQPNE